MGHESGHRGHGHHKKWSEMSTPSRVAVVVLGTGQVLLHAYAWQDLIRRPAAEVMGPKLPWGLALLINWAGPIAYLFAGRTEDAKPLSFER
ncbi:PLDc_N domain-containing protein [Miniimonas arenae]|uniref:PLDc_N domain-containing protein n=2 Tax=Miniimonas arenae TaxID=676201 RepID=A0A5C5BAH9_9MICO|nr:PLDc_N domain-containing protein [Miniimonas arenae]